MARYLWIYGESKDVPRKFQLKEAKLIHYLGEERKLCSRKSYRLGGQARTPAFYTFTLLRRRTFYNLITVELEQLLPQLNDIYFTFRRVI